MSNESRAALVTGAGSGMGLATARRYLDDGWTVLALDASGPALEAVRDGLGAAEERFVPLAIRKGVAVLFLDFTGYMHSSYGATKVDCTSLSPTQVAMLVGKAAAQEMRRVDQGR